MKNFTVRLASEKDAAQLAEWITKTPNNLLDPEIVNYPTFLVLVVEMDGKPIIYFPYHLVMQGESLALNPDAEKKDLAYGFRVLDNAFANLARANGVGECYFACADESFAKFAERHTWTPIKHKYLRRKTLCASQPATK